MANANATAVATPDPKPAPLKLAAVNLARPVSLAGTPSQHFTAAKYDITIDDRGDVRITDRHSGHQLFVPKQQAILEYSPRG